MSNLLGTAIGYGPLATVPGTFTMATTDVVNLGIDMTNVLTNIPGGGVANPVVTLTDEPVGTNIPLNPPTIGVSPISLEPWVVIQTIIGSALTIGHKYLLRVVFTAVTTSTPPQVLTTLTNIQIPA